MMGDLFERFRSWAIGKNTRRKASAAQQMARKWKRDAYLALRKLNSSINRLELAKKESEVEGTILFDRWETVRNRVDVAITDASTELEEYRSVIKRYDKTEEALSSELEVLKDVTLPELMLQREWTRQHLKADMSVLTRHAPPSNDEE